MLTRKNRTASAARSRTKKPAGPQPPQSDAPPLPQVASSSVPLSRAPDEQVLIDEWRQRRQAIPQVAVRETASGREDGSPSGDHALWAARLAHALKTADPGLLAHLIRQVASCVWKTDVEEAMNLTVAAVAGIGPRDQLEALLTVQMVSVHNVAMELLQRTMLPDQTVEGVTVGVQRATSLLRVFAQQMDTLQRYRGGGKQTVTVQHVQVDAGGQAIVGNVHHGPSQPGGEGDETPK